MNLSPMFGGSAYLPRRDLWTARLQLAAAMGALCWAKLLVATIPFSWWRRRIGGTAATDHCSKELVAAQILAAHVDEAALRLPGETKCLPRAMALSWMLRRRHISHSIVIAVRPSTLRHSPDALHAWVEVAGDRILGDLPGRWAEILRLGS